MLGLSTGRRQRNERHAGVATHVQLPLVDGHAFGLVQHKGVRALVPTEGVQRAVRPEPRDESLPVAGIDSGSKSPRQVRGEKRESGIIVAT
jgi:hypothetical protein